MQFIDLKKQQNLIRDSIRKRIDKVLEHGKYILGPEVKELESKLANFVERKYAVGVASGTDALLMSLMAYNIGKGDAVFTTPFTFIATASMIKLVNATSVFVDIKNNNYNIDPDKLETQIQKTLKEGKVIPKAIIAVDIFGQLADYEKIQIIAKKYGLVLIEDAAQSFGASYKGKKSCAFGDISTTSFFPAKPLGCYGDGGMIFTDNEEIYNKLLSIRVHGKGSYKYDNVRLGINGRLDTIQAAILLSKMEIFDNEVNLRQQVAKKYSTLLKDYVTIPFVKKDNVSAWAQYSILSEKKEQIINYLKKNDIPTAIYYPIPLHLQKLFKNLNYKKGDFPVCEKISENIFSIPFYPYLDDKDIEFISGKIIEVIK